TAMTRAEDVLADGHATAEAVADATNAIYDAITNLEDAKEDVNKASLQEKYEEAKSLDVTNKTNASKENLEDAIAHAESILNKDDVTQDEVDNALQTLQAAIDSLEEIEVVNKDSLQEKVDQAKAIDLTNKTEPSKTTFNEALAKAEDFLKNEEATQEEVNAVLNELTEAMEQLKEKDAQEPEDEESNGPGGSTEQKPGKPEQEETPAPTPENEKEQDSSKENLEENQSGGTKEETSKDPN